MAIFKPGDLARIRCNPPIRISPDPDHQWLRHYLGKEVVLDEKGYNKALRPEVIHWRVHALGNPTVQMWICQSALEPILSNPLNMEIEVNECTDTRCTASSYCHIR